MPLTLPTRRRAPLPHSPSKTGVNALSLRRGWGWWSGGEAPLRHDRTTPTPPAALRATVDLPREGEGKSAAPASRASQEPIGPHHGAPHVRGGRVVESESLLRLAEIA